MVANFHDAAGVRERRGLGSGLDQPAGWHSLSLAEPSRTFGSQAHTLGAGATSAPRGLQSRTYFGLASWGRKRVGVASGDHSQCEHLKLFSRSRPYYRPAVTDPSALRRRAYTTTPRPCAMPAACRYSRTVRGCNRAPAPSTTSQRPRNGVAMTRCGRTHRPALQGAESYGREDHGGHGHEPNGQGGVSDPRERLERDKRLKDDGDDVARAAHDKLQPRQPE